MLKDVPEPQALVPHSVMSKAIHWGFIVVFIYALTKQLDEVEELEDFSLLQYEMVFATFFLVLLVARFVVMQTTRPTALPASTPRNVRRLARTVHLAMYGALASIALSGLMIGGLYGSDIKAGIAMEVALWLHEIAVNGSFILITGHILAAVYHRRRDDGIWQSMVPNLRRQSDMD